MEMLLSNLQILQRRMYFTAKIRTFECGMALAGTVCTIPMHRRKRVMTISEVAKTPVAASALS